MNIKKSQKSYVPSEKDAKQKWFIVDVKDKPLGRAAAKIANLLRGKGKLFFTPQRDCGDFVIIVNASEIKLAGTKMDTKLYHWHTGYGSGLRTRTAREMMNKKPEKVLFDAVWGMMPRNKLRRHMMKKLRIFPGVKHNHESQRPVPVEL